MFQVQAPLTVEANKLLATRQKLSLTVMFMGLCFSAGGLIPCAILIERISLGILIYCPLFALAGYGYAFFALPFKFQLWDDSSVIFEHFPWKSAITIHLKLPFNSNLKQVVRDIPQLVAGLHAHKFHDFNFSSPIFVKNNGDIRSAPLKLLEAQFAKRGYTMTCSTSKMPSFTKFVYNAEYKRFYRTNTVPADVQNTQSLTVNVTTSSKPNK